MSGARWPRLAPFLVTAAVAGLIALVGLPLLALLARATPGELARRLGRPEVLAALRLSLETSAAATALVVALGLPVAWLLGARAFPGRRVLETLVELPLVLPPTVAGFALLLAFGRAGLAGRALAAFGVSLPFSTAAVVLAQAFMSVPLFVTSARAGLAGVDPGLLEAAATLRASEAQRFVRVALPLAAPSLLAGTTLAFARALGEFGATLTFAGNLPGVTQTLPLAVYMALESDLDSAIVLAVLLLVLSAALLAALRAAGRAAAGGARAPGLAALPRG